MLLWFVGQSIIANQCHSPLSDMPVAKLTNPMQLVIQFTMRFSGCSQSFSLSACLSAWVFHYLDLLFICCGLDCSFLLPTSCCVCFLSPCCQCVYTNINLPVWDSVCDVCVCMLTVHASLWDTLISAHCGSAPSCPHGWLLIETNQACDGPIAVTPHPSHLWPNHLLIGPRRAPSRWHGRLIWPVDEGSRRE